MLIEIVFDYIIHLFDFIKNEVLRAVVQIFAMLILTVLVIAITEFILRII